MNYEKIYNEVWFGPGYSLLDIGEVDAYTLRREMIQIKDEFSKFESFSYSWLMRFDQQVTTDLHQDGGPDENMLVLGYEPSEIKSILHVGIRLPDFKPGHSYILILNNSNTPQGVKHKADIVNPDPSKPRVINSIQVARGRLESEPCQQSWLNQIENQEEPSYV